jgi:hypothetical protein
MEEKKRAKEAEERPFVTVKLNTAVKTVLMYSALYLIFFAVHIS